ncbi:hypothetical protein SO694_00135066 [Aureococcus anophagefferens]|uniref:Kinesin motor domain-containing protein n=1 Tax=Aureococcus anophagefferens TaxID=44056 RepID=A0ABR1GGA4_AURAN
MPRALNLILERAEALGGEVKLSFMEIYNENVYDLMDKAAAQTGKRRAQRQGPASGSQGREVVPWRDSKLTHLFQYLLAPPNGGLVARVSMIVNAKAVAIVRSAADPRAAAARGFATYDKNGRRVVGARGASARKDELENYVVDLEMQFQETEEELERVRAEKDDECAKLRALLDAERRRAAGGGAMEGGAAGRRRWRARARATTTRPSPGSSSSSATSPRRARRAARSAASSRPRARPRRPRASSRARDETGGRALAEVIGERDAAVAGAAQREAEARAACDAAVAAADGRAAAAEGREASMAKQAQATAPAAAAQAPVNMNMVL